MNLHDVINKKDNKGNFILSPLPYTDDHLEPYIGERTVRFHYWKHLKAYIDKVNSLKGRYSPDITIEELIRDNENLNNPLYKNATQVHNHYFYFEQLNPNGIHVPMSRMQSIIERERGSWDKLKSEITDRAMNIFGSGWVFLVLTKSGRLSIMSYTDSGTPRNVTRLLALDVWEHAYYLDYQNDRKMYIESFFKAIDWCVVERRLQ